MLCSVATDFILFEVKCSECLKYVVVCLCEWCIEGMMLLCYVVEHLPDVVLHCDRFD